MNSAKSELDEAMGTRQGGFSMRRVGRILRVVVIEHVAKRKGKR